MEDMKSKTLSGKEDHETDAPGPAFKSEDENEDSSNPNSKESHNTERITEETKEEEEEEEDANFEFADVSKVKAETEEESPNIDPDELMKILPESILKNDKVDLEAISHSWIEILTDNKIASSDSDSSSSVPVENTLTFLATTLGKFPIMLSKSQVPEMKRKKEAAIQKMVKLFEKHFGTPISSNQLLKKINNMKTRLKKKLDQNATGNKPIVLNTWEKEMLPFLQGDTNPVINKLPGAVSLEPCPVSTPPSSSILNTSNTESVAASHHLVQPLQPKSSSPILSEVLFTQPPPTKKLKVSVPETEETKILSTTDLHRLVLLEQLQLVRMQKEKERMVIDILKRKISNVAKQIQEDSDESAEVYTVL